MKKNLAFMLVGVIAVLAIGASDKDDEIQNLQSQLDHTQQLLNRANSELTAYRELPIRIGKRKSVLGNGYVLQIENNSTKSLPLKITLHSPTFDKSTEFDEILPAARVSSSLKEIGKVEGWDLAAGDDVVIESKGFTTLRKKVD